MEEREEEREGGMEGEKKETKGWRKEGENIYNK